jgi:methylmalonyl-CoA mutase
VERLTHEIADHAWKSRRAWWNDQTIEAGIQNLELKKAARKQARIDSGQDIIVG